MGNRPEPVPPNCTFRDYRSKLRAKRALVAGWYPDNPEDLLRQYQGKWGFWVDDALGTPTSGAFPEDLEPQDADGATLARGDKVYSNAPGSAGHTGLIVQLDERTARVTFALVPEQDIPFNQLRKHIAGK